MPRPSWQRRRRLVRYLALSSLLLGVAGVFGITVYRLSLQNSPSVQYRHATLDYWLLAPGVIRRVPLVEPMGERSYVYRFVDNVLWIEDWNELHYRSAAREAELRQILDRFFEAEGYVENPDRGGLERLRGDESSELGYHLEPTAHGVEVTVSHVVIRDQEPSVWTKAVGWFQRAFGN